MSYTLGIITAFLGLSTGNVQAADRELEKQYDPDRIEALSESWKASQRRRTVSPAEFSEMLAHGKWRLERLDPIYKAVVQGKETFAQLDRFHAILKKQGSK